MCRPPKCGKSLYAEFHVEYNSALIINPTKENDSKVPALLIWSHKDHCNIHTSNNCLAPASLMHSCHAFVCSALLQTTWSRAAHSQKSRSSSLSLDLHRRYRTRVASTSFLRSFSAHFRLDCQYPFETIWLLPVSDWFLVRRNG